MGTFIDLTGKRFGRWIVIEPANCHPKRIHWLCRCDCGETRLIMDSNLRCGSSKSCGCSRYHGRKKSLNKTLTPGMRFGMLTTQQALPAMPYHHPKWLCLCDCGRLKAVDIYDLAGSRVVSCGCKKRRKKDNATMRHPLYGLWWGMRQRCSNLRHISYRHYGGRGIAVCAEWSSDFWRFVRDMGDRPPGYSIERIDNDGDYCPENCCWASKADQVRNTRRWKAHHD